MGNKLITRRREMVFESSGGGGGGGSDPWDALFAAINNGTYQTDYSIGDLIPLDLGTEGEINMQIVAFDADTLASGQGTAPVSLISEGLLATQRRINPAYDENYGEGTGTIGGWKKSEIRDVLISDIKPLINSGIRSHIVSVNKYTTSVDTSGTFTHNELTADELWLPSFREMMNNTTYETQGPAYNRIFNSAASRQKKQNNNFQNWWLRSADESTRAFKRVLWNGNVISNDVANALLYSIALGFCVG